MPEAACVKWSREQGTRSKEQGIIWFVGLRVHFVFDLYSLIFIQEKMNNLISPTDLQQQFNNAEFVLKTQQQIAKDFEKFNLMFDTTFQQIPFNKEEIQEKIAEHVSELMKEGETRLLQLLYTIDLSEKEFLSLTTEPDFLKLLSEKILFREAYKVFLRAKFK